MLYKTLFYGAMFRVWIYKIQVSETDKKHLPLFVYWPLYKLCKQPLRYLNKSMSVLTQLVC